jgi:hypothetical protein
MRVEVGGVECEHIRREFELGNGGLRNCHLRLRQGMLGDLLRYPMKSLPAEGGAR